MQPQNEMHAWPQNRTMPVPLGSGSFDVHYKCMNNTIAALPSPLLHSLLQRTQDAQIARQAQADARANNAHKALRRKTAVSKPPAVMRVDAHEAPMNIQRGFHVTNPRPLYRAT